MVMVCMLMGVGLVAGPQAQADEPTPEPAPVVCDTTMETYWHDAYDRAQTEAMKYLHDYYRLGNLVDDANRRIDHKIATIERLRAKVQRLKGNDHISLDYSREGP
jgi:hypothetical protein